MNRNHWLTASLGLNVVLVVAISLVSFGSFRAPKADLTDPNPAGTTFEDFIQVCTGGGVPTSDPTDYSAEWDRYAARYRACLDAWVRTKTSPSPKASTAPTTTPRTGGSASPTAGSSATPMVPHT